MSATLQFETDGKGVIITKPMTGWTCALFAEIGIILAIHYADNPQALEVGESKSLQFVLTPQQSIDLADQLKKLAKRALDHTSEKPAN